jgi:DNA-binding MarR family transcriptional regulator
MAKATPNKNALARRVWTLMFELLIRSAPDRMKILGNYGLTPNDARGLSSLDPEKGKSMRLLAEQWSCDASNATWIVDRLEEMGLAERRTAPKDRRVKLVALTQKGLELRTALQEKFNIPPAELLGLGNDNLRTLEQIMRKIDDAHRMTTKPDTCRE